MKQQTENEYQKKVNEVIDYIHSHLHESLNLDILAQQIYTSPYHFHRIMRAYLGEPLSAYITRQRLERAAVYLQDKKMSLIEIADRTGYETQQSFSKAFKKHFGITPLNFSRVFKSDFILKRKENSFRKIELNPEICEQKEVNLIYIRIIGKYGEAESYNNAWKKLVSFMKRNSLANPETRWLGISFDDPNITRFNDCRFYACASLPEKFEPQGEFGSYTIPAGKYAVYTLKGSYDQLQNFYDNIYFDFSFSLRNDISFEEYINNPENTKEDECVTKIFIPVN